MYILNMGREIRGVFGGEFHLKHDGVVMIYEKMVTRYGNGAKVDAPKRYLGKRAYIVIVED